ncbi:General transcription and DNA repair factor IIH helicase subunit XPD, partial [Dissostichus eleginoides]
VEQSDDPDIEDIAVGLLMISARSTDTTLFCPERIAVVIEGNRVIELPTLADAFILLFALTFALHLSYPKDLANTLNFTQKVLMGLDELEELEA